MSRLERETANLIRDILNLPERERVKVFEKLREDLAEVVPPAEEDKVNERMANAIEIFNQVADHLGLDTDEAKLALRIREFDAAPERVRGGAKARQLASAYLGRWELVKAAAAGEDLTVSPTQKKLRDRYIKEQRRTARVQEGLYEWIATGPERASTSEYNRWQKERNNNLKDGELPFVSANQIVNTWRQPWSKTVADARAGTLTPPLEHTGDPYRSQRSDAAMPSGQELDVQTSAASELDFDPDLVSRRLLQARTARGYSRKELARISGLAESPIDQIEDGKQGVRITFRTLLKLARALEVSIDYFGTPDGKAGLPPRSLKSGIGSPRSPKKVRKKRG